MFRSTQLFLCVIALLIVGCSKDVVTPPPPQSCAYTLGVSPASFPASGGSGSGSVTNTGSASGCSWSLTPPSLVSYSGPTNGTASASFAFTVPSNPDPTTRNGNFSLAWSGNSSGSDTRAISVAAAATQTLTANFDVSNENGTPVTRCDVRDKPVLYYVACKFDGSTSTPSAQITSYQYVIVESGDVLGSSAVVSFQPLPKGCAVFTGSTNGQILTNVRLTVTSATGASNSIVKSVTFIKNGVC